MYTETVYLSSLKSSFTKLFRTDSQCVMKYLSLTVDSSQQVPVLQLIVIPWLQSHVRLALQIFALPKYCDSQDTTDVLRFMKSRTRRT